jgi:hypothetical protein
MIYTNKDGKKNLPQKIYCDTNFWIDLATNRNKTAVEIEKFVSVNRHIIKIPQQVAFELVKNENTDIEKMSLMLHSHSDLISAPPLDNIIYSARLFRKHEEENPFKKENITLSPDVDPKCVEMYYSSSKWKHKFKLQQDVGDCIIFYHFCNEKPEHSIMVTKNIDDFNKMQKAFNSLYKGATINPDAAKFGFEIEVDGVSSFHDKRGIITTEDAIRSLSEDINIDI